MSTMAATPGVRTAPRRRVLLEDTGSLGAPVPPEYLAYGLRFRSQIVLPFVPAAGEREPDVVIRLGSVPEMDAGDAACGLWSSRPDLFTLNVDAVARYAARDGREIVVDPAGDDATVRTFLLGSVLAACLQQRGMLTLHASAVATPTGAVLFAGASGHGKSTLAAAFVERGYPLVADDVTAVVLGTDGRPTALPAFPCLRLWEDALDCLAWQGRAQARVRDGLGKHFVPVGHFSRHPLPVRAIFVLFPHNRGVVDIASRTPAAAFERLLSCTYRKRYVRGRTSRASHFRTATALAARVPLAYLRRPSGRLLPDPDSLVHRIEHHLETTGRTRPGLSSPSVAGAGRE